VLIAHAAAAFFYSPLPSSSIHDGTASLLPEVEESLVSCSTNLILTSFELMRKEQHKSLQEKKNNGPDIEKGDSGADIMSMVQNSTEYLDSRTNTGKLDGYAVSSIYQEDTTRSPSILPAPAATPLVQSGFSHAFVEKNFSPSRPTLHLNQRCTS
jgi:hypothetical protein